MPDTLTDDHISWTQKFTGVTIGGGRSGDAGTQTAPTPNGSDQTATSNGADQSVASTDKQPATATGPGTTQRPAMADAGRPVDANADQTTTATPDAAPGDILDSIGGALSAVGGAIVDGVKAVGGAIEDAAVAVGRAVGIIDPPAPPKSIAPPILGPAQQKRADDAKAKLSPEDQKKYQDMLDGAKSDKEKQYLQKGLAAGHSMSELQSFQSKIAGKDEKWMQDNLSLTGNSQGKGVKQQWSMSCNATTAEAVRGQMDPLYALKMHEDNPDVTDADNSNPMNKNANLAADQKAQLETAYPDGSTGGLARARNDPSKVPGRWNTDLLNKDSDSTGMKFENKKIGDGGQTVDQAVDDISSDVEKGMPVPIVIGDGGEAKFAHYVLVTAVDKGPPKAFSIHDPANGTTEVRTEDELKNGKIDLAGDPTKKGSGWNKLSAYEKPTPVAVK